MHAEAMEFLRRLTISGPVIEIGSRNVNGSARDAFSGIEDWTGIDRESGPCVHVVAAAQAYWPAMEVQTVICCEVLEHDQNWKEIVQQVGRYNGARRGLTFVITCAGPGRKPHSAIDGGPLRDGEYYSNISAEELRAELIKAGFRTVYADQYLTDTRAIAMK